MTPVSSGEESRFVYLYSDEKTGNVFYVGRGTADRVTDHGREDANAKLAERLDLGEYVVESMDCGDAETAKAVEGALISAGSEHKKFSLLNQRRDEYQFSPIGVPLHLSGRGAEEGLSPEGIVQRVGGPVLFVYLTSGKLNEPGRKEINPAKPDPEAVADRLLRHWYTAVWSDRWARGGGEPAQALVGLTGKKHRYVIGAVDLSDFEWSSLIEHGNQREFPVSVLPGSEPTDDALDALELRGRRVPGFKFGQGAHLVKLWDSRGEVSR